jgi:hypothetical protein
LADQALLQVDMLEVEIGELEFALVADAEEGGLDVEPRERQGEFDFSAR